MIEVNQDLQYIMFSFNQDNIVWSLNFYHFLFICFEIRFSKFPPEPGSFSCSLRVLLSSRQNLLMQKKCLFIASPSNFHINSFSLLENEIRMIPLTLERIGGGGRWQKKGLQIIKNLSGHLNLTFHTHYTTTRFHFIWSGY